MHLRNFLSCLLIAVVFAAVIQTIPTVRAQYVLGIDITGVPVGSVPTETKVHLTFSVYWSNLSIGWYIAVAMWDIPTGKEMPSPTATGSPNVCYHFSIVEQGACVFPIEQPSGIEAVAFDFPAPSTPQTLHLEASGCVIAFPNASQRYPCAVAANTPEISILVANQAQSTTYPSNSSVTYTPYTSYNFSSTLSAATPTPSLQMPQPPQPSATQSTNNTPQLALALAVIAAVVIGAVFLYQRQKKQPKVTQAEKVDIDATRLSTKTAEGKRLCIECGNELPPNLRFCDSCGTKQP